jgi:hypothetical protein
MKQKLSSGAMLILFASLVGCTAAPDRILYKEYAGYNYCHMKVETGSDPANPSQREVIDFYGPWALIAQYLSISNMKPLLIESLMRWLLRGVV